MDLTASSGVNFPITSASLRLVVVWMGVRSIRARTEGHSTRTIHFHNKIWCFLHGFSSRFRMTNKWEGR